MKFDKEYERARYQEFARAYLDHKRFCALCQQIADDLNHSLNIRGAFVTAEQVACVAAGTERTVSHPVISAIMTELRRHKVKINTPI